MRAPAVFLWPRTDACLDRVHRDIAQHGTEVGLITDRLGPRPALEDMTATGPMPAVERKGVLPVEPPKPRAQITRPRDDEHVQVRVEQNEGDQLPAVSLDRDLEESEIDPPVN